MTTHKHTSKSERRALLKDAKALVIGYHYDNGRILYANVLALVPWFIFNYRNVISFCMYDLNKLTTAYNRIRSKKADIAAKTNENHSELSELVYGPGNSPKPQYIPSIENVSCQDKNQPQPTPPGFQIEDQFQDNLEGSSTRRRMFASVNFDLFTIEKPSDFPLVPSLAPLGGSPFYQYKFMPLFWLMNAVIIGEWLMYTFVLEVCYQLDTVLLSVNIPGLTTPISIMKAHFVALLVFALSTFIALISQEVVKKWLRREEPKKYVYRLVVALLCSIFLVLFFNGNLYNYQLRMRHIEERLTLLTDYSRENSISYAQTIAPAIEQIARKEEIKKLTTELGHTPFYVDLLRYVAISLSGLAACILSGLISAIVLVVKKKELLKSRHDKAISSLFNLQAKEESTHSFFLRNQIVILNLQKIINKIIVLNNNQETDKIRSKSSVTHSGVTTLLALVLLAMNSCNFPNTAQPSIPDNTINLMIVRDLSKSSIKSEDIAIESALIKNYLEKRINDTSLAVVYLSFIHEQSDIMQNNSMVKVDLKSVEKNIIFNSSSSLAKQRELRNARMREKAGFIQHVSQVVFNDTPMCPGTGILEMVTQIARNCSDGKELEVLILSDCRQASPIRNFYTTPVNSFKQAEAFALADLKTIKEKYAISDRALQSCKIVIVPPLLNNSPISTLGLDANIARYFEVLFTHLGAPVRYYNGEL